MPIIEGTLADIDGVRRGQIAIDNGIITAVGANLGTPTHVFGDDCLIFAGMGDIHIHAREDVTGKEMHKETFACVSAAALHGGVVHVADMPNNPAAPIDDASYAAKETLLRKQNLPVVFTLYAGIGPGTRPLAVSSLQGLHGAERRRTLLHVAGATRTDARPLRRPGGQLSLRGSGLADAHKGAATHEARRPPECELGDTLRPGDDREIPTRRQAVPLLGRRRFAVDSLGQGEGRSRDRGGNAAPCLFRHGPDHASESASNADEPAAVRQRSCRHARSAPRRTADYLATDHAPHTLAEKERGVSGQPHLDTYGPFVTWLIVEQGFTPERIAAICSANPGTFVNPYQSEKWGRLLPGYVGSLTVLDLRKPVTIRREDLRTKCGWSPFEEVTFPGSVAAVFVRGVRVQAPG